MEENFVLEKQHNFIEEDLESKDIIDDIEKMVNDIEDNNHCSIDESSQEKNDHDDNQDNKEDDADGFAALGLSIEILSILKKLKFIIPTEIQKKAIPVAISGKDVLGSADTGTGKTLAFCVPLLEKLIEDPSSKAMILAPTRELAMQIEKTLKDLLDIKPLREDRKFNNNKFNKFGGNNRRSFEPKFTKSSLGIEIALIIGGEYIGNQFRVLKNNPRIIIGTPGRVNDHIERQTLDLNQVNFVVLDETDRMLDMGFSEQIDIILRNVKKERQMLLFSATIPPKITGLVKSYMNEPISISTQTDRKNRIDLKSIKHDVVSVTENEKYNKLLEEIQSREGAVIIFVKTKFGAESLMERLKDDDQYSEAIHGNLKHRERLKVIAGFRAQKFRIVIGTDIISRGIDIPDIAHVINFDLPDSPEDYIHRIGRTARAGAKGAVLTFVTPADKMRWLAINKLIDPEKAQELQREYGFSRSSGGNSRGSGNRGRSFNNRSSYGNGGGSSYNSSGGGSSYSNGGGARKPFGSSNGGYSSNRAEGGSSTESSFGGNKFGNNSSSGYNNSYSNSKTASSFRRPDKAPFNERRGSKGGFGGKSKRDDDYNSW